MDDLQYIAYIVPIVQLLAPKIIVCGSTHWMFCSTRDLHGFINPCRFTGTGPGSMGTGKQIGTWNLSPTRH